MSALDDAQTPESRFSEGGFALLEFEFSLRFELGECDALLEFAMERLEAAGSRQHKHLAWRQHQRST